MSFGFNYKFWVASKSEIDKLLQRQNVLKHRDPIDNPAISFRILAEMFVMYIELTSKLGHLYQHTVQVQKREVVKNLLEPMLRTLLMLKNELKNLEFSEFVYVDSVLVSRKLTPFNLAIWRSPDFLYRRPAELQNIIYDNQLQMNERDKQQMKAESKNCITKAVIVIQSHEKSRQARVYKAAIMYDKKQQKQRVSCSIRYAFSHKKDQGMSIAVKRTIFNAMPIKRTDSCQAILECATKRKSTKKDISEREHIKNAEAAALTIQGAWRVYQAKKQLYKKQSQRKLLYGYKKIRKIQEHNARTQTILDTYQVEEVKRKLDDDYYRLIMDERTRLLQERAPQIMEDISDHIREWFREFYNKTGDFHPYPEVAKQGTVVVLFDDSMSVEEFKEFQKTQNMSKEEKKARAEKLKLQKQKEKEKYKKMKLKEIKRRKKLKDAGIFDIAYLLGNNKDIENMEKTMKQYLIDWRNVDEYLNKHNEAISQWVTEKELATIHRELRILVDEFMRLEYELLKNSWFLDKNQLYKGSKQGKPQTKSTRREKKLTDPTANRSIGSIYQELKEAGIIEKVADKNFDHFVAEFNFLADDLRDEYHLVTSEPTYSDLKYLIQECMLGLGSLNVDKPKSLCLIGPTNTGKKLLCRIVASDTDALFMNLSPEKTYQFANNLNYFLHIVMKVAKAFQPTILFIHDAHRIFCNNPPKDQLDIQPNLLQDAISRKILKYIRRDDRIMLIGTSVSPWSASPKFKKAFQKILPMPRSNYGTTFLLWLDLILQYASNDADEDYVCSALAKVFSQYNTGDIVENVAKTLSLQRRMRLHLRALHPSEFLDFFMDRNEPFFQPEEKILQKYEKFFSKSNQLCKLKTSFLQKQKAKEDKKK